MVASFTRAYKQQKKTTTGRTVYLQLMTQEGEKMDLLY